MAWGIDPALDKHYVPTRSQRSRSVLTFFAQDSGTHNLVYANADLAKATQNREVIGFCDHWRTASGNDPHMLVMDQKVTTQPVLAEPGRQRVDDSSSTAPMASKSWLNRRSRSFLTRVWSLRPSSGISHFPDTPDIVSCLSTSCWPFPRQILTCDFCPLLIEVDPEVLGSNHTLCERASVVDQLTI